MKKIFSILPILFLSLSLFAQEPVEMADDLRASGKIYIVVAVVAVIMAGIIIYLFTLDRKISEVEKRINKK